MTNSGVAAALVCLFAGPVMAQDLPTFVNGQLPGLVDMYKGLHAHPEFLITKSKFRAVAAELRKAGYTVTEHVGKYPDGARHSE